MVIVLIEPPTVTEAEQEIGVQQAEDFVASRAAKNFLMASVVDDEAELREDEGQERSVAKFDPGIVKSGDQYECADEQGNVEKDLSQIIRGLFR